MVPVLSLVGMAVAFLLSTVLPVVAIVWLVRRQTPDGIKRYPHVLRAIGCGALTFVLSQILTRIPLMGFISGIDAPWAQLLVSPQVASFTAGLFEETGRLLIMLWLMKRFHRWLDGVAFGLGHGGIEAILLVGLSSATNLLVGIGLNSGQGAAGVPPEVMAQLQRVLIETGPETFFLSGVERVAAIALHIGLSVMILWGIVAGRKLLFWALAIVIHGMLNLTIVTIAAVAPLWLAEVALVGLVGVFWWLFVLRSRPWFPTEIASEPPAGSR